jgi:hypothetical protein
MSSSTSNEREGPSVNAHAWCACNSGRAIVERRTLAWPGDFSQEPSIKPAYGACYITPATTFDNGDVVHPRPVSPQKSFSCSCFPIPA